MAEAVARAVAAPVRPEVTSQEEPGTGGRVRAEIVRNGEPETMRQGRREMTRQRRPGIVQWPGQLASWWLRHWLRFAEAVGAQWR